MKCRSGLTDTLCRSSESTLSSPLGCRLKTECCIRFFVWPVAQENKGMLGRGPGSPLEDIRLYFFKAALLFSLRAHITQLWVPVPPPNYFLARHQGCPESSGYYAISCRTVESAKLWIWELLFSLLRSCEERVSPSISLSWLLPPQTVSPHTCDYL